ncbi:hypothetical protein KQX54_004979 [Cotesia glomerata]|uniref:Uncharacterized protein n=1 Tax=Cotesia glomerata TaxID=32391 RepID=A0AAV7HCV3_COTGL|nr:hypothetical protein KQX54_004979 [Cotesia glomerata]
MENLIIGHGSPAVDGIDVQQWRGIRLCTKGTSHPLRFGPLIMRIEPGEEDMECVYIRLWVMVVPARALNPLHIPRCEPQRRGSRGRKL